MSTSNRFSPLIGILAVVVILIFYTVVMYIMLTGEVGGFKFFPPIAPGVANVVNIANIRTSSPFLSSSSSKSEFETELSDLKSKYATLEQKYTELEADKNNLIHQKENIASDLNMQLHLLEFEVRQLQLNLSSVNNQNNQLTTTKVDKDALFHDSAIRPGVIILGMHRSGTSVVGGLMSKMKLQTGGPLIRPAEDNEKGFFERIDVVLQNDYLFFKQNMDYSQRTHAYDSLRALKDILTDENGKLFGREGKQALNFLNNPQKYPWMLKDPRLCITIRTWLPLLNFIPAVLFTYRNPLDVALSMNKREHFAIGRGMRLWYVYNKRAIQNSNDLCRVLTSHRKVMRQPDIEMKRIVFELRRCGVSVPREVSQQEIAEFVDVRLQHGNSTIGETLCNGQTDFSTLSLPDKWQSNDPQHLRIYQSAMKFYCDMENNVAFREGYQWDEEIKD